MIKDLYATASGCSDIISVEVEGSHTASTASASVNCRSITCNIGSDITIDVGYTDNHHVVFLGYVKQIERKIPDNTYVVTAKDRMQRAIDYYFASTNPETPFSRSNILAENLVEDVLAEAGLTSFTHDPTYFTMATGEVAAEVNLVSAYDYANGIADLLAYNLWCDTSGTVHFENRKPYPMDGGSGQPGDSTDETGAGAASYTYADSEILGIRYKEDERDLRNRIVVYGAEGIYAEAHASSPYLPSGFYKSAVLSSHLITQTNYAEDIASYNLDLYNKLVYEMELEVEGVPEINARDIVRLNTNYITGVNVNWYAFAVSHRWSQNGYINSIVLRR